MDQFSAPSGAISEHDDPEYEKYYWHNGARLALDQSAYCLNDRGFNYGHGLFETFRIRQGCPLFWSAHEKRLIEGLLRLGLLGSQDLEGFIDQLKHEVANLVFPQPQGVLKLVVTAGSGPRGYAPPSALRQPERFYSWSPQTIAQNAISDAVQTTATDTDCARAGQALMVCAHRLPRHPALAGIKHLNRLDQVLGATEAKHLGFDDGLMLDQAGFV
ncbi:MAG: aminotransferase class IV, partial [Gammaproteobacteria bacterium]